MTSSNFLSLSFSIALFATLVSSASIYIPRAPNSQTSEQGPTVTAVDDSSDPVSGINAGAPAPTGTSKQIIHGLSNSGTVALFVILGAVILLIPMFGFIWIRRQKLRRAARIKRMKSRIELAQRRKGSAGSTDSEESPRERETRGTGLGIIQKPLPAETAKALPALNTKEFS